MTQGMEARGAVASVFTGLNWEIVVRRGQEASDRGVCSAVLCSGIHSCVPITKKSQLCLRSSSWQKCVRGIRVTGALEFWGLDIALIFFVKLFSFNFFPFIF